MKIRIRGNTLRYRLTKSEIKRLALEGSLEERSEFPFKTLLYSIEITDDDRLLADYVGNRIVLRMPKVMMDELSNSDKVGFADQNGPVSLLVEKDFTCLSEVDEDQSDNFPNPMLPN